MAEPPDSATERSTRSSAWGNRLISAALGILVTVVGAVIIGRLQERRPNLTYSSTESLPFNGPNGEVSIYQVTVSNDGKEEASDVACGVRIPSGKIEQYRITSSPLIGPVVSASTDSLSITVPNLNPGESFQVSLLGTGSQSLPTRPEVAIRGKGIVGTEKNPGNGKSQSEPTLAILAAAISAVAVTGSFTSLLRGKSRSTASVGSGDDQRQVLAYICRAYGLKDLADQYSSQPHETTYWAEADRLGEIAIDGDGPKVVAIEKALLALIDYYPRLSRSSKSIVYYNVALINRCKGDQVAFDRYLQTAKETAANEIERRLKIDPRFAVSGGRAKG